MWQVQSRWICWQELTEKPIGWSNGRIGILKPVDFVELWPVGRNRKVRMSDEMFGMSIPRATER